MSSPSPSPSASPSASPQLPLIIPATPDYSERSFLPSTSNQSARTWLARTDVWPDRRLALWGDADRGKTHLLRIWANSRDAEILDGTSLSGFPEMAASGGAALDNAERADEAALLHLLNTARDLNRPILLASRIPPARWRVTLRDLSSRLRAITSVEVEAPDEELLRRLLMRWLAERKLFADETLHDWLLLRLPRDPEVLRAAVRRLDEASLVLRRREVTPAMMRAALVAGAQDDDFATFTVV